MISINQIFFIAASLLVLSAPCAHADTYYVTSVVGNTLNRVDHEKAPGTLTSSDKHQQIDTGSAIFDDKAIKVISAELKKYDGASNVIPFRLTNPSIFTEDVDFENSESLKLALQTMLKDFSYEPHAKLLVILPWRSKVLINREEMTMVKGLGVYLDLKQDVRRGRAQTFDERVAVFANMRIVLIDLDQATLLATRTFRRSRAHQLNEGDDLFKTPERLNVILLNLIQNGCAEMVPQLFKVN